MIALAPHEASPPFRATMRSSLLARDAAPHAQNHDTPLCRKYPPVFSFNDKAVPSSAISSAKSRTKPSRLVFSSSAGISRTSTAPGPKTLQLKTQLSQFCLPRHELLSQIFVHLHDFRNKQKLARHTIFRHVAFHALID